MVDQHWLKDRVLCHGVRALEEGLGGQNREETRISPAEAFGDLSIKLRE
jgi:hypothetical protein